MVKVIKCIRYEVPPFLITKCQAPDIRRRFDSIDACFTDKKEEQLIMWLLTYRLTKSDERRNVNPPDRRAFSAKPIS